MANSFNAASSSSPRMTHSCKYRIKFLITQVALLLYMYLLSLPYLFSFCKIQLDAQQAIYFILYHSRFLPSIRYSYGKFCVSSCYYFYLPYYSFHMGNHTDSCQSVLFLNSLLVMKNLVIVSDLCLTYVILLILIYALGLCFADNF